MVKTTGWMYLSLDFRLCLSVLKIYYSICRKSRHVENLNIWTNASTTNARLFIHMFFCVFFLFIFFCVSVCVCVVESAARYFSAWFPVETKLESKNVATFLIGRSIGYWPFLRAPLPYLNCSCLHCSCLYRRSQWLLLVLLLALS